LDTKLDIKRREQLLRVDNNETRYDIEVARKLIFKHGIQAGSKYISDILGSKTIVPTRVSKFGALQPTNQILNP